MDKVGRLWIFLNPRDGHEARPSLVRTQDQVSRMGVLLRWVLACAVAQQVRSLYQPLRWRMQHACLDMAPTRAVHIRA